MEFVEKAALPILGGAAGMNHAIKLLLVSNGGVGIKVLFT